MPKIIFINNDTGEQKEVEASVGLSILEIAHKNAIDIEGNCGGSMSCGTCHVIIDQTYYDKLPEITEGELDVLDIVFNVSKTSRLGCQIIFSEKLEDIKIYIPPKN